MLYFSNSLGIFGIDFWQYLEHNIFNFGVHFATKISCSVGTEGDVCSAGSSGYGIAVVAVVAVVAVLAVPNVEIESAAPKPLDLPLIRSATNGSVGNLLFGGILLFILRSTIGYGIMDDDGDTVNDGEEGKLGVRGLSVDDFNGYRITRFSGAYVGSSTGQSGRLLLVWCAVVVAG